MSKRGWKKNGRKAAVEAAPSLGSVDCDGREAPELLRENEALRKELVAVLANALENEKIWRHFAAIERVLFRTRDMERLVDELLSEIKERFETGLLVLFLSHPEVLERFFQGESPMSIEKSPRTWISPLDGESAQPLFGPMLKPILFASDRNGYPSLLSECGNTLRSGALIPMKIGDILFGALLLGSRFAAETLADAAEEVFRAGKPLENANASLLYRKRMLRVLAQRALEDVTAPLR